MANTVIAVFSATHLAPDIFRAARNIAESEGSRLVLLEVRHLQQARRLGDFLAGKSYLGQGAVRQLQQCVKAERGKAIGRALRAMEAEAASSGIEAQSIEVKGELLVVVREVAEREGAGVVVVEGGAQTDPLTGPFRVVRV